MLDRCYLAAGLPTLVVWGERDRIIPVRHAYAAQRALPGSQLEIFANSGHFPHHDEPDRFATIVRTFLTSTAPSSYDPAAWREMLRHPPIHPATLTALDDAGANSSGS